VTFLDLYGIVLYQIINIVNGRRSMLRALERMKQFR